jgi:putative alpha-1,2-mannosidase
MYLNGKAYNKSFITFDDIKNGAEIYFVMSSKPNYRRAVSDESIPPSISTEKATKEYKNP